MKTSNEPYKIKEAEGVEEDEADDLQEDVQAHECTPGDGDSLELGDGLLIVRQPKKSDADIVTAEVSTVRLSAVFLCKRIATLLVLKRHMLAARTGVFSMHTSK